MSTANKNNNSTSIPLKSATEFVGLGQSTTGFTNILVNIRTDKKAELTIQQSADKVNWDLHSLWTCDPAKSPTGFLVQEPASLPFFRVKLLNTSGEDMTRLRLISVLNLTSNVKLNVRQDNTLISGEDTLGGKHTLATTSTGDLIINGTGGSATRPVYLMDIGTWYRVASVGNTPGHVWTAIGAIVGSETDPTIGRLFKCLSAPANIEGQGTVYDVEYSDTVTATPVGTQDVNIVSTVTVPVSGSVALLPAVDPTLTVGTVRLTDTYGSPVITSSGNLMVGINNIYTANPLHTILDSGSVSVTGSVAVTNADITSIKTNTDRFGLAITGNYAEIVIENYTNISLFGGYVYSLNVYSNGTLGTNFIKLYGITNATNASTPLIIIPVPAGQSVNLALGGLKCLTGISVRATANYVANDNTAPTNLISCSLTFSPLL